MAKLEVADFEAFRKCEGKSLPAGDWLTISQEQVNDFARATGDFQWIHTDPARAARESPFGKPVAHGFLSLSLISRMLGDCVKVGSAVMGVNYGLNKVRFPSPVAVNSRVRLQARVCQIEAYGKHGLKVTWDCIVEIEGAEKPACAAEFISLMFEQGPLL